MSLEQSVNLTNNVASISSYKIPFSIPRYITSLVLPKCVMVHSEILASVYLQIALHINHEKNAEKWKKKACWMKSKVIAKNTGYNVRSINNAINTLEHLNLIKVTRRNRLITIRLWNNELKAHESITNFNTSLENTLLADCNKTKSTKHIASFRELERSLNYSNPYSFIRLTKSIWFPDVKLLRNWIVQAEGIYKGSSLFFVNDIAPQIFDYIGSNKDNSLENISENQRAIRIGSSQSTINRYLDAYQKAGCITVSKSGVNTPIEMSLNKAFLREPENIEKRVVVCTMTNEKNICPICQSEFDDYRSLSVHLSKKTDKKHKHLNLIKKQNESANIHDLYNEYKDDFDAFDSVTEPVVEKKKSVDQYLNVVSDCKMTCKECHRTWKLDYFNDCKQERKVAFIQEYGIVEDEIVKKEEEIINDIENQVVAEKPAKKPRKKPEFGPDTAPGLVEYFYKLTGGFSPNIRKESSLVKKALTVGVTPDGARTTMNFLHRKGQTDLRFFNNASIREAHMELELMAETEKEGTIASLVKMYYDGMEMPLNVSTIIKDVQRIQETMNTGLDFEQTKFIVQYMIDVKCPTLNFIVNKRNEALAKRTNNITFKQNPCMFDRDEWYNARLDLAEATRKLIDVVEDYGDEAISLAKEMFKEGNFAERFTHFEWAWKIGLELDNEMYKIAMENRKIKKFRLDVALTETTDQDRIQKIIIFREKFYSWLNEQQALFETAQ